MRFAMLVAAVIPGTMLILLLWERARFQLSEDRLWGALGVGALMAFPVVAVGAMVVSMRLDADGLHLESLAKAFLDAAIPEEAFKFVAVVLLHHDRLRAAPVEIVTIGAAVGAGFAATENLGYFVDAANWGLVAVTRSLTAVPMHIHLGLIMGICIARTVRSSMPRVWWLAALVIPTVLHGGYDYFAFATRAILQGPQALAGQETITYVGFILIALATIIAAQIAARRYWDSDTQELRTDLYFRSAVARSWIRRHAVRRGAWLSFGAILILVGISAAVVSVLASWESLPLLKGYTGRPEMGFLYGLASISIVLGWIFVFTHRRLRTSS